MRSPRQLPLWLRLSLVLVLATCVVRGGRLPRGLWGNADPGGDYVGDEDYGSEDGGDGTAGEGDENEVEGAHANVELTQFDYSDACGAIADARWKWLLAGEPGSGPEESQVWRSEAMLGSKARDNVGFMKAFADLRERLPSAPAEVVDQVEYALHAGDLLLPEAAFLQKLNYSRAVQRALSELRVPCHAEGSAGGEADCFMTLPVVRRVLARSGDAEQLLRAWRGAQAALRPLAAGFPAQLQLARAAAIANEVTPSSDSDTMVEVGSGEEAAALVGAYWLRLQDPDEYLEMSYPHAQQLWEQLKPLHRLLVAFVRERLQAAYGAEALAVQGPPATPEEPVLPAHLTGSLVGDDWSALADLVFPSARLRDLDHALRNKDLKGKALYNAALETLNASLGIEDLPRDALIAQVRFDGECPSRMVHNCSNGGASKVLSCSHAGWMEYAEAHEVLTRLAHAHFGAEEDKKALLRVATRYSATHDMLPAIVRLLSLHPDRLEELEVLPDEAENDDVSEGEADEGDEGDGDGDGGGEGDGGGDVDGVLRGEATLRLLTALRTLPRLAYYAAADAFRLRLVAALANATVTADPVTLWAQIRREYMLVAAPAGEEQADAAWLADPALAGNVPLLGRFFAELLTFQALEYLASYNPLHPLPATREDARIPLVMKQGHSKRWPELLNDQLDINELRAEPLLRYFAPLKPLLSPKEAAKATPPAKREAVDLTPPVPPPSAPPSSANPFFFPFDDALPSSPESSPADPSASVPGSTADTAVAGEDAAPSDDPTAPTRSNQTARVLPGGVDNATAHTAVLATSLAIFGAALAAGAVVGGRRLLKKRTYQRNRRPDAQGNATKNSVVKDVEAVPVPEEAEPVNVNANANADET